MKFSAFSPMRLQNARSDRQKANARKNFRHAMMESLEDRRMLALTPAPIDKWIGEEVSYDKILVRFQQGTTKQQATQIAVTQGDGAQILKFWDNLNMAIVEMPDDSNRFSTPIQLAAHFHQLSSVLYAEPDFVYSFQAVPNDPTYPAMDGLDNTGQNGGTPDADIDAPEAWDLTTGSTEVVIAIIDSGLDTAHPDIAANVWVNPGEIAGDGIDNDGNGYIDDVSGWDFANNDNVPNDVVGHGTHVAGTVAAVGNNGVGVTGVSWNSKLLPLKIGEATLTTAAIVEAIQYATMMRSTYGINIPVSNNSYGGYGYSQATFDAVAAHTGAGILFVAAAGNDTNDNDAIPSYPAGFDLPGIVAVAASDNDDQLAGFSNYGTTTVDIAGPGVSVTSTWPTALIAAGYNTIDGTSMASPHVAGVVALMNSLVPGLSIDVVKAALLAGADVIPAFGGDVAGNRRLNALGALNALPRNEVNGRVFNDVDRDGVFDSVEVGVAGIVVYADMNNNAIREATEPFAITAADGTYQIKGLLATGVRSIRVQLPNEYLNTVPTNGSRLASFPTNTSVANNVNFGVREKPGQVWGFKWQDLDDDLTVDPIIDRTDGIFDPSEQGLGGVVIYVDYDNNGKIGIGEPSAVTYPNGQFTIFDVIPGTHTLREVNKPGFLQTFPDPSGAAGGGHTGVVVLPGQITYNVNFGNRAAFDYGDAPAPYPTTGANAAYHGILPGFGLGALTDAEGNGQPSATAIGDDANGVDDEDGVNLAGLNFIPGSTTYVPITTRVGAYGSAFLQVWVDFNRDGDWDDSGEHAVVDLRVGAGTHQVPINIPATAVDNLGSTFMRVRYGFEKGVAVSPGGFSAAGEVEDYQLNILGDLPVAQGDSYSVQLGEIDFPMPVLANDVGTSSGPAQFVVSDFPITTAQGGTVTIDTVNNRLLYDAPISASSLQDSFQYRVTDGVNTTGFVTVNITLLAADPIAVDNTYLFTTVVGQTLRNLTVTDNDFIDRSRPYSIDPSSLPIIPTAAGSIAIAPNGYDIIYTQAANFQGVVQFDYVLTDTDPLTEDSTATVTIQVTPGPTTGAPGQSASIRLEILRADGTPIPPGGLLQVGDEFIVRAYTRDLRGSYSPPTAPQEDDRGVDSAYIDVLFNTPGLAVPNPAVVGREESEIVGFDYTLLPLGDPNYPGFVSGSYEGVFGYIDELGAFRGDEDDLEQNQFGLGTGDKFFFDIRMTATNPGQLQLIPDPADTGSLQVVLFNNPDEPNNPQSVDSTIVLNDLQVLLIPSNTVTIIADGEGEFTNLRDSLDVNADGNVSAFDALLVINHLNANLGTPTYEVSQAAFALNGTLPPEHYLDVSADSRISPYDALLVINELNRRLVRPASSIPGGAEGEAEGEFTPSALVAPEAFASAVDPVVVAPVVSPVATPVVPASTLSATGLSSAPKVSTSSPATDSSDEVVLAPQSWTSPEIADLFAPTGPAAVEYYGSSDGEDGEYSEDAVDALLTDWDFSIGQ